MLCCLSKIVIVYILFTLQSVYFQPRLKITTWLLPTPISLMSLVLLSYEAPQAEQDKHTLYGTSTVCHLFRLGY